LQTTEESLSDAIDAAAPLELSLVVPVFNEEESVGPLVDRICAAMANYPSRWELILVDDGSTDATLANARKYVGRDGLALKIVELQRNFGQTAAMQAGIDTAAGRLIATMDGDLQNDPNDIPGMVAELERRELDLLVGWRKNRQDGLLLRKIPSWCANYLIGRITGVKLHDYGCSLKIYRASDHQAGQADGRDAPLHPGLGRWRRSELAHRRDGRHPPCARARPIEIRHFADLPRHPRPALGDVLHALQGAPGAFLRLARPRPRRLSAIDPASICSSTSSSWATTSAPVRC
jgi:glycosyltransferase involved in cell wall biosynthesis